MILFKEINADNIEAVVALEVSPEQQRYLETTNLKSFADAYESQREGIPAVPLAIYAENDLIGFVMYSYDTMDHESFSEEPIYEKKSYFISQFMIDQKYQGQGYGRAALKLLLEKFEEYPFGPADFVALFHHDDNQSAQKLYQSFGFFKTDVIQGHSVFRVKAFN